MKLHIARQSYAKYMKNKKNGTDFCCPASKFFHFSAVLLAALVEKS